MKLTKSEMANKKSEGMTKKDYNKKNYQQKSKTIPVKNKPG